MTGDGYSAISTDRGQCPPRPFEAEDGYWQQTGSMPEAFLEESGICREADALWIVTAVVPVWDIQERKESA